MIEAESVNCTDLEEEDACSLATGCYWQYNGLGIDYQVGKRLEYFISRNNRHHECIDSESNTCKLMEALISSHKLS